MNKNEKRLEAYQKNTAFIRTVVPAQPTPTGGQDAVPKESVHRRVAKFLMIIGMDEAGRVMSHLTQGQIEKIIPEMASIKKVGKNEAARILEEFQGLLQKVREGGGVETARAILEQAFGAEKAAAVLEKAVHFPNGKPFQYLNDLDSQRVFMLIQGELPAVQCMVLSQLPAAAAAAVIGQMDPPDKIEAIKRLSRMSAIDPEILRRVDKQMFQKYQHASAPASPATVDGRGTLSKILRHMNPQAGEAILEDLDASDTLLAQDLRKNMFTVDDVPGVPDFVVERQLGLMEDGDVAKLIAGKGGPFRDKIFACLSKGRGDRILEEESLVRPFRRSECDAITGEFLGVLRRETEHAAYL
ncbi:MAG: flagellar motor switch protein FliG [Spirochaetaceae bacterium]|jgi:flagellar motor switch protein FliG|nr:flagellar motor switch protein FliG [Spirochaetaceae bacterium]